MSLAFANGDLSLGVRRAVVLAGIRGRLFSTTVQADRVRSIIFSRGACPILARAG